MSYMALVELKKQTSKEKDGSEASSATLAENRLGVKRSLPADGLEEAELQRPVKLGRLTI